MNKIITYQKGDKFVVTRMSEKNEFDAEEILRHIRQAREQYDEMKRGLEEFKRDLVELERLESVAKRIRDKELELASVQRGGVM